MYSQFSELANFSQTWTSQDIAGALVLAGLGFFIAMIVLGIYIYSSIAWMTIAKKLKHKHPWLAWIPLANLAMMLQLGGFDWKLIFLALIPILGWIVLFVLVIIATWRIFEKRHYPGWFSLSMVIPRLGIVLYLIAIGLAAWKKK